MWPKATKRASRAASGGSLLETQETDMHPFRAGDIVECIDDAPLPDRVHEPDQARIRRGRIYRVRSVFRDDGQGYAVCLEGVGDCPTGIGWHASRFRRLEAADADFCALLRSIPRERSALEREIIAVLEATAHLEGTICTYVPGMTSDHLGRVYQAAFGPIPPWVLALHPKRRSKLYTLAAERNAALPGQSPVRSWQVERAIDGTARLVPSAPGGPWTQPRGDRQARRS